MKNQNVDFSLHEFVQRGQLGEVAIGDSRAHVLSSFGNPDAWQTGVNDDIPQAVSIYWVYGDFFVWFDRSFRVGRLSLKPSISLVKDKEYRSNCCGRAKFSDVELETVLEYSTFCEFLDSQGITSVATKNGRISLSFPSGRADFLTRRLVGDDGTESGERSALHYLYLLVIEGEQSLVLEVEKYGEVYVGGEGIHIIAPRGSQTFEFVLGGKAHQIAIELPTGFSDDVFCTGQKFCGRTLFIHFQERRDEAG